MGVRSSGILYKQHARRRDRRNHSNQPPPQYRQSLSFRREGGRKTSLLTRSPFGHFRGWSFGVSNGNPYTRRTVGI